MALRNIRKDGDPLLRKRSKEIETIDTRLKILLDIGAHEVHVNLSIPIIINIISIL